ncbi:unnamed protein product, partial [Closterium sp. NIES-64]
MAEAYNKKGCDDEYDMKEECPRAARSVAFRSRVAAASVARRRCYDLGGVAAVISAAACAHQPDPPHFPPFLFNPFPPFPFVPSPPARAHTSVFPPPFSSPPPIVCSHGAASPLWSSDRLDHLEWRGSGPHREWQQGVAGVECDQQGERVRACCCWSRNKVNCSFDPPPSLFGASLSCASEWRGAGPIANGSRGWLVSSVTGRERECGREIVNVLDEWCDKLEAGKAQGEGEGEARTGEGASAGKAKGGSSIDALLANEVAALKKQARLQSGCGAVGVGQWVWGSGCGAVGVGQWVWGSGCGQWCGAVGVGQWVWGSGSEAVGVGQWVWGSGCGAVGVGQWVWGSG